jgi:hypothetical protein
VAFCPSRKQWKKRVKLKAFKIGKALLCITKTMA